MKNRAVVGMIMNAKSGINMPTLSRMIEYPDRRVWNIEDYEVSQLQIDYQFRLVCLRSANTRLSIVIESVFTLQINDKTIFCEPANINSIKDAIFILHKPLSTFTAYRDGLLLVTFSDGTELYVPKNLRYESWEAQGIGELDDLKLLCSPHEGPPWNEILPQA